MEVYETEDHSVSKYIHDDGSETAIKTVSSCNNVYDTETNHYNPVEDRNKYVVFVSSSVGCKVGCKFCYLTAKKFPYYTIEPTTIINNLKEAISHKIKSNPQLAKKYIKLSFMGMGDALYIIDSLPYIVKTVFDWVIKNSMAVGVDGVDIGTTFPNFYDEIVRDNLYITVSELREIISTYRINHKSSYEDHHGIRIFFSLHSFDNDIRRSLIPKPVNADVIDIVGFLKDFSYTMGIGLIFHQMFIAGINDSEQHVDFFVSFFRMYCNDYELRILKFNECQYSDLRCPSDNEYNKILDKVVRNIPFTKVQFSAGSEVKASCGQFLMPDVKGD